MSDTPSNLSLFKRSNGIYYILFEHNGNRRWRSTGCTIKADAVKALINFKSLPKEKPKLIWLAKFGEEFIEYAKVSHAKGTVTIFKIALNHLNAIAGSCPLPSLTPQHVDFYKAKRLKDDVSPVTINVELRALRTMLNVAVRWQKLDKNPFAGMRQMHVPERRPTYLTKQDFQILLIIVKENWLKELIVFAVLTGMRRGEILNLKWRNVELSRKVLHIETDATFKTKAGKSRVIPLSESVFDLLSKKAIGRNGSEYVFNRNIRQIDAAYLTHKFKDYVVKAKLDNRLHWHSLRHTFASWLVQDGVSLFEVQKLL